MSSTFFEDKRVSPEKDWLMKKEFPGKKGIKEIRIEGELLISEIAEGEDYDKIFNYLNSVNSFEDNPIHISKQKLAQLAMPLSKEAVILLSGCGYMSNETYFDILHRVVTLVAANNRRDETYELSDGDEEILKDVVGAIGSPR